MFNLSSAEGARFAEVCEEMTAAVQALGPSPLNKGAAQATEPSEGEQEPAAEA
jgi:hypothetical protein